VGIGHGAEHAKTDEYEQRNPQCWIAIVPRRETVDFIEFVFVAASIGIAP